MSDQPIVSNKHINHKDQQIPIDMERFRRLISYYGECIENDLKAEVSFFANDQSEWLEVPAGEEFSRLSKEKLSIRLSNSKKIVEFLNAQGTMGSKSYFYGYPIFMHSIYSAKNKTSYLKAEPFFYLRLERQETADQVTWDLVDVLPEINPAVLKTLAQNAEETREFLAAIEYGEQKTNSPNLVELLAKVTRELGSEIWCEGNGEGLLHSDGKLANRFEQGLYHRAMIFTMDANPYTQGLEKELRQLTDETTSIEGTSLATLMGVPANDLSPDETPLSHAVPLNARQSSAVKSALTHSWTVITGPPGTGKSQVVTAIVLNATLRGQNVLLASHNHKAVDVVIERANGLDNRPLLLKLGRSDEDQDKLAGYILNLLGQTPDVQTLKAKEETATEIKELENRRKTLFNDIHTLEDKLEAVDRSEQGLEQYREMLGAPVELVLKDIKANAKDNFDILNKRLRLLLKLKKMPLGHMFFRLVRNWIQTRIAKPLNGALELINTLDIHVPEIRSSNLEDIEKFSIDLLKTMPALNAIADYRECLGALPKEKNLEFLQDALLSIDNELAVKGLKFLDLWSQSLADDINDSERQSLSKYQAGLRTLADGGLPKKAYMNLKQELDNAFKAISKFIPGWAVTNLSAKGRVPFIGGMFDLVVIDEASQCDIPSALPLLYRAKRAVIIGDPNQLQHITQLRPSKDHELRTRHGLEGLENAPLGYSNSLFNLAQGFVQKGGVVELLEHHRSHHEIIEFSNRHFYQGRLKVVTDYRRLKLDQGRGGLRWVDIKGWATRPAAGGAINDTEAKMVADEVVALIKRGYPGSVGVTTPFRLQANRIRDLINKKLSPTEIESRSLIVDVVHKFQGDERDCMFFSLVVSEGVHTKSLRFLNSNRNLFNVAVTRARSLLIVVGDLDKCSTCGVDYLEKFAAQAMLSAPNTNNSNVHSDPKFESPWEKVLFDRLSAEGLKPMAQYSEGPYRLDITIIRGKIKIDIEVDGERYHKNWSGNLRSRDLVRNMRLQEQGWLILRFWVYEVRDDMDGCIQRVNAALRT
jgi:very-short-patch-repair endonuclease